MAIDGIQMNLNPVNPYSAAAEKAIAAQRAAGGRKKVRRRKGAIELTLTSNPEQAPILAQWMDSGPSQARSGEGYRTAVSGCDSDFG